MTPAPASLAPSPRREAAPRMTRVGRTGHVDARLVRRHRRAAEPGGGDHRCDGARRRACRRRAGKAAPTALDPMFRGRGSRARGAAPRGRHWVPRGRRAATSSPTTTSSTAPSGSSSGWPTARRCRRRWSGSDPDTDIALHQDRRGRTPAARGGARRLRHAARGRVGGGDRQSAGLRAHGDRGRRQLHRPQALRLLARSLHPDRRGHQSRQQRRSADQHARRSGRHQRRGQLARAEHRLRRADQPGQGHPAAAARERAGVARLHRRGAARRGSPTCSESLRLSVASRRRWCRT